MSNYQPKYDVKNVRLERIEPIPKLIFYKVQPQICYMPSYVNYKINVEGKLIERKYEMEEETVKEEVEIKDMSLEKIIDLLESKQIRIPET